MGGTDEPWKDFLNGANNGTYVLHLDPSVINAAAQQCADAVTLINGVATEHAGHVFDDYGDMSSFAQGYTMFGMLPSGQRLQQGYMEAGKHLLNDVIPGFTKSVTQIAEGILKAGKVLQDTDGDAGKKFTQLTSKSAGNSDITTAINNYKNYQIDSSNGGSDSFTPPDWWNSSDPTAQNAKMQLPALPFQSNLPTTTIPVTPDPPDPLLSFDQAERMGTSLDLSGQLVAYLGGAWTRMGRGVWQTFSNLGDYFSSLKGWDGASAQAAMNSVMTLSGQGVQLGMNMEAIGSQLNVASGWVSAVYKWMPHPSSYNMFSTPESQKSGLKTANLAMNIYYNPGIQYSSTYPTIDPPVVKTTGSDNTGGHNTGGSNTGGSNTGGSNTGGGPSAADTAAMKKQQADQQAAERAQEAAYQKQQAAEKAQEEAYAKQQAEQQKQQREAEQKQQEEQQKQQQEAEQKQQQEQQQQQAQQAAQQAMQAAQQAVQQGMQAAQQAAQQASQAGALDAAKSLADGAGLAGLADSAMAGLAGGGLGGAVGAAVKGVTKGALAAELQASKLFPRAALAAKAEEAAVEEARAGMAAGSGGMGPMGGMGAAQKGGQDKEKKRAEFLDSEEWLTQALGEAPIITKPVVEK